MVIGKLIKSSLTTEDKKYRKMQPQRTQRPLRLRKPLKHEKMRNYHRDRFLNFGH
jgi:hypothetical protein